MGFLNTVIIVKMEINFNNLRLLIQSDFNIVIGEISELLSKVEGGEMPSETQKDLLYNSLMGLRENLTTLMNVYGENETIDNISNQCFLSEVNL